MTTRSQRTISAAELLDSLRARLARAETQAERLRTVIEALEAELNLLDQAHELEQATAAPMKPETESKVHQDSDGVGVDAEEKAYKTPPMRDDEAKRAYEAWAEKQEAT